MNNDPVQAAKSFEIDGKWVKWSRYDLLNGVIVPAEGAELQEYDPWDKFRANAGKYRTVDQPYTALLALHRNLEEADSRRIWPSPGWYPLHLSEPIIGPRTEADELILAWCNQHGLLGLVPVLCNSIRLESSGEQGRTWHVRDGGIWRTWSRWHTIPHPDGLTGESSATLTTMIDMPPAGITWFDSWAHFYQEKPLEYIELFFRPVHKEEPLNPPCPNTLSFWKTYGEPLQDFAHWCWTFGECVTYMSQVETAADDVLAIGEAHRTLSGLAQSVAPTFLLNPKRRTVDEARVSAGLLASYALMFLWDRMEKRRAIRCANCNHYFVSDVERAGYCSPRCRNTAQKRRSRTKQAESQDGGRL